MPRRCHIFTSHTCSVTFWNRTSLQSVSRESFDGVTAIKNCVSVPWVNSSIQYLGCGFVVDGDAHVNSENYYSTKEIMQHGRSAPRITLADEQCGLNSADLIEMSGLFPGSLIKRQVLIFDDSLDPARGGGEWSQQTNQTAATTFITAILTGLNSLIKSHLLSPARPPLSVHKKTFFSDTTNSWCALNSLQTLSHSLRWIIFLPANQTGIMNAMHHPAVTYCWTGRVHGCSRSELIQNLLGCDRPPPHVPIWPVVVYKTLWCCEIKTETIRLNLHCNNTEQ